MSDPSIVVSPAHYENRGFENPSTFLWGAAISFKSSSGVSEAADAALPRAISAHLAQCLLARSSYLYVAERSLAAASFLLFLDHRCMIGFSQPSRTLTCPSAACSRLPWYCAAVGPGPSRGKIKEISRHSQNSLWLASHSFRFFPGSLPSSESPAPSSLSPAGGPFFFLGAFFSAGRWPRRLPPRSSCRSRVLFASPLLHWYILWRPPCNPTSSLIFSSSTFKRYLPQNSAHANPSVLRASFCWGLFFSRSLFCFGLVVAGPRHVLHNQTRESCHHIFYLPGPFLRRLFSTSHSNFRLLLPRISSMASSAGHSCFSPISC